MYDTKILIVLTVYITAIFSSNLLGLKTFPFFFNTHISFAVFTLPFVFITTDIIGKVYGEKIAKYFLFLGFLGLLLWTVFSLFAGILPWSMNTFARIGEAYDMIFSLSIRVAFASLCAFLASEYLDVIVFLRYKNQKSSFWVASTLSNIISQGLDSLIFLFIAFYGIFEIEKIWLMFLPWWIYKVSMGILYMPFSYAVLHYFTTKKHE